MIVSEHGHQHVCGMARALHVVGDRRTRLIGRERMLGYGRAQLPALLGGLGGAQRAVLERG